MSKTTPKKLTPRQQEVLEFIRGCIEDKYPPTLHEIGSHFGFSEKAATDHVNAIEKKGYIQRVPNVPRSITIVEPPQNVKAGTEYLTLEITPEIEIRTGDFSVGDFIRVRRQLWGESDDVVLVNANGTLMLHRILVRQAMPGVIGKVVGHTIAIA